MEIITEFGSVFMIMAVVFGIYLTWGIGANDVANAMGTTVGSGAITVKQAIIIAAIFEFAGAFIAGGSVTKTIRKGIINPESIVDSPEILLFGMLAAMLAAAIWLMIASWQGWPVSTTHTIIGGLVGFAVVAIGIDAVNWGKIGHIVASWLVSPLIGGGLAFVLMVSIQRLILRTERPFENAQKWGPMYVFLVGWIVSLVTMFKGLKHLKLDFGPVTTLIISVIFGLLLAYVGKRMINRIQLDKEADQEFHYASVEKAFAPMMIFTACAMAFASLVKSGGEVGQSTALPLWILALGGIGIVFGLVTLGYRVMRTIGNDITDLTPTRGYCATLAAAITVVLASKTGLPVSTTQIAVGAVMGVGFTSGLAAVDMRVVGGVVISWFITLPAGAIMAILFFYALKGMFGISCPVCI
jgi:PiT family inorganic phosphate transporter